MKTRNVYWRKSNRHHWNCIAICPDKKSFIRQIYLAQRDAPKWQVGWIREDYSGGYPDNKTSNYPMNIAPNITDITSALESFINYGFTPINPPIIGKFVELELLEKE